MKVLKFFNPACGPCKVVESILNNNKIEHESIDVFDGSNAADISKYDVRTVPTTIIMKGNREIRRFIGVFNINDFKKVLDEAD